MICGLLIFIASIIGYSIYQAANITSENAFVVMYPYIIGFGIGFFSYQIASLIANKKIKDLVIWAIILGFFFILFLIILGSLVEMGLVPRTFDPIL